jgi:hypothetical protein
VRPLLSENWNGGRSCGPPWCLHNMDPNRFPERGEGPAASRARAIGNPQVRRERGYGSRKEREKEGTARPVVHERSLVERASVQERRVVAQNKAGVLRQNF